jgi:hypothetical protein
MSRNKFVDIMNPPDYDASWIAADLPDHERAAWREVLAYRTKLPNDAVTYSKAGLTPQDLKSARTDPLSYWPGHVQGDDLDSEVLDRFALLATETARFHEAQIGIAREIRQQYMRELSARGRSHESIGAPLGLSRQRVRAIVKGTADIS